MKRIDDIMRVPGAMQREALSAFTRVFDALWPNGAAQTRDPGFFRMTSHRGPGSAVHRFAHAACCTASGTQFIPRRDFLTLHDSAASANPRNVAISSSGARGECQRLIGALSSA